MKKFNVKPENKTPWFDKALVKLRRTRDNLYHLALDDFKLTNNMKSFAWLKFASIRNLFKSKFRQAKALHFKDFIGKNSTSSPKLWSYINPLLTVIHKSKQKVSSILNKFVFISISLCLDYISTVFESSESLLKTTYRQVKFSFRAITDVDVKQFLPELDELSAPGISGIESKLIKHCADSLIQPLV